jgi:hypothetical protein
MMEMMQQYRAQEKIDGLVAQAVENFRKNHCDEGDCEIANEKVFVKKLVFDPATINRIDCNLCAKYGVKMPKDALDVFRHLKGNAISMPARSLFVMQ